MFKFIVSVLLLSTSMLVHAIDYYISQSSGNDNNSGLSSLSPFQTLTRVNSLSLSAGDSVLFESGERWEGMLWPKGSGTSNAPITISVYGSGTKPIIDGDGYQASILLFNDEHYVISGLELTNQASHSSNGVTKKLGGFGNCENSWGSGRDVRFGIKVVASNRSLEQFTFSDLAIHNIFPTPDTPEGEGTTCTKQGHNTTLKNQGYGIKFESQSNADANNFFTISDVVMDNITVSQTGHYGVWIKPLGGAATALYKHDNITVRNSLFLNTGGAGFVPTRASNVLVENNVFDGSGSSLDSRMYARGSGTWPFDSDNVVIQNNVLMNAKGPLDSYGVHIDYNNTNVLVQYNFSYNNEGGFVQILGANVNSGYRYNISVADGSRVKGVNGATQDGRIFNVSSYCNISSGCASTGSFIYNNTVYVPSSISPKISFQRDSGEIQFYNNLIYVQKGGSPLHTFLSNQGVQYDIGNNLFYPESAFSLAPGLTQNAIYTDPKLQQPGSDLASGYELLSGSSAKNAGAVIAGSFNSLNYSQNNGGFDFFGNPVSEGGSPHIGAYNGTEGVNTPMLIAPFAILLAAIVTRIAVRYKKD